jgi:carboxymethylenebutenolidase
MSSFIEIKKEDGRVFSAYLSHPEISNGKAIVLLPEVYNINQWVQEKTRKYARAGYTVIAPDLFWRQKRDSHYEYSHPTEAREQGEKADIHGVLDDIGDCVNTLKKLAANQDLQVSCIGFCLGGRIASLAAQRSDITSSISYYGVKLEEDLEAITNTKKEILFFFGSDDIWVSEKTVHAIEAIAKHNPYVKVKVFTGAKHGFDREIHENYSPSASEEAFSLVNDFLQKTEPMAKVA